MYVHVPVCFDVLLRVHLAPDKIRSSSFMSHPFPYFLVIMSSCHHISRHSCHVTPLSIYSCHHVIFSRHHVIMSSYFLVIHVTPLSIISRHHVIIFSRHSCHTPFHIFSSSCHHVIIFSRHSCHVTPLSIFYACDHPCPTLLCFVCVNVCVCVCVCVCV